MAKLHTGEDEDGEFGLTVEFDENDVPQDLEPTEVKIRVNYRHENDISTVWPEMADDPEWDPEDSAAWVFELEGRAVGTPEWMVLATGAGDTLPQSAAMAVHTIEAALPGDLRTAAKHRIGGSEDRFREQFGDAFDVKVGNDDLLPEGFALSSSDDE